MLADLMMGNPTSAKPFDNGTATDAAQSHRPRPLASSWFKPFFCSPVAVLLLCSSAHARSTDVPAAPATGATGPSWRGRADEATNLLQRALSADGGNGVAHLLLCRVLLSEDFAKDAAIECQAALSHGLARDSDAQDWTGRALGGQAVRAGMLSGMRLALGVHTAFESAVTLAPYSEPACVDLGEFYTAAPALVGGGTEKALALAHRIERTLPEIAHRIRAMAAEKNGDLGTAEREFGAAGNVAHRPGALVDLAAFYGRHGQTPKAIVVAEQAIAADRVLDASVVEAAGILADRGTACPGGGCSARVPCPRPTQRSGPGFSCAHPTRHVVGQIRPARCCSCGIHRRAEPRLGLHTRTERAGYPLISIFRLSILRKSISRRPLPRARSGIVSLRTLPLALACIAGPAAAQISLPTAIDLALQNNPKVKIAEADLRRANAVLSESRDVFVPAISVSGGVGSATGAPLSPPVVFSVAAQSLVYSFSQPDYIRAAHAGVHSAQLALDVARTDIAEDVTTTYLSLGNAEERRERPP